MYLLCGEFRIDRFQSAVSLRGANPHGQTFLALAHALDHVLRALRRVNGGGNCHTGQGQEIFVSHQLHFGLEHLP
ncbi:hypothetical protein D3C78_1560500 [compost metagenome]